MRLRFCAVILYLITPSTSQHETATMSVNDRVQFLKFQLEEQMKMKHSKHRNHARSRLRDDEEPGVLNENYDYVDLSQVPITPIMEMDERKKDERYKLRQLKTTTTTTTTTTMRPKIIRQPVVNLAPPPGMVLPPPPPVPVPFNPLSDANIEKLFNKEHRAQAQVAQKRQKRVKKHKRQGMSGPIWPTTPHQKPIEVFYRKDNRENKRRLLGLHERDIETQWTHCEEMLTPYLTGQKTILSESPNLEPTHRTVLRTVHLLNLNTTKYSKQDIYSLMYQISNIQLRLFQWDDNSIKMLFNILTQHFHGSKATGKRHTFKTIKGGVKRLFQSWHLDISNTSNLLAQSRVFRPLCISIGTQDGSTKSSKVLKYTKKGLRTPKRLETCNSETEECSD